MDHNLSLKSPVLESLGNVIFEPVTFDGPKDH